MGAAIGREHPMVRAVRPAYEALLDLVTLGRGFRRTVNGTVLLCEPSGARTLSGNLHQRDVWSYLRARIQPGDVVLNVGAHVGLYTLGAAAWSAPNGRVIAFEPNPETRKILTGHVRRNRLSDRIEVLEMAAGARDGEAEFVVEPLGRNQPHRLPESRQPRTGNNRPCHRHDD